MSKYYLKTMNANKTFILRELFIEEIYKRMIKNKNIFFLTDDFGAIAIDKLKKDFSARFINVGIAEQNLVNIGLGLSAENYIVVLYGISSFLTMRAYEQLRNLSLFSCLKNLNINLVGVGIGFSYDLSGPTHYCIEDISIIRTLPNFTIYSPSDSYFLNNIIDDILTSSYPKYIRFEGKPLRLITNKRNNNFSDGLSVLKGSKDIYIIATGNMVHRAMDVSEQLKKHRIYAGVIDLYRIKPLNEKLLSTIVKDVKGLVTLEEHFLAGGIGSLISEFLVDNNIQLPLKRIGIKDRYYYVYGGRENIQKVCGLDKDTIVKEILTWRKKL